MTLEVCGSGIAIGLGSQARPVSIFSRQGLGHVVPSAGHGPTHTSSQVAALPAPRGAAPALHTSPSRSLRDQKTARTAQQESPLLADPPDPDPSCPTDLCVGWGSLGRSEASNPGGPASPGSYVLAVGQGWWARGR